MHANSIPEPSESPKSQLHDAIERIQSLHKRRNQIKTIYENERQYLDQRSQKTKSSFEGLIVSTEEQIQSINEVSFSSLLAISPSVKRGGLVGNGEEFGIGRKDSVWVCTS